MFDPDLAVVALLLFIVLAALLFPGGRAPRGASAYSCKFLAPNARITRLTFFERLCQQQ